MFINFKKYISGAAAPLNIDYSFSLKEVEIDGYYPFVSPIHAKGKLSPKHSSALLEIELSYDFSMPCNRCMEDTLIKCKTKVSHTLVLSLNEDEDLSYIQVEENDMDLDELLYSDIILELPTKYICKEDCKGLCSTCGANLNSESCNCNKSQLDPRLEVLKSLIQ